MERLNIVSFAGVRRRLREMPSSRIKMAGIVIKRQEKISAKGNKFAFLQLSDATGVYEVTIFSETLSAYRDILNSGDIVLAEVDAQVQGEDDDIRFLGQRFEPLDKAVDFATENAEIRFEHAKEIDAIKSIIDAAGYGRVKVSMFIKSGQHDVEIALPASYALNGDDLSAIRKISGVRDVTSA